MRHHRVKGIHSCGTPRIRENPRPLAEIVDDEHHLHENPGHGYVEPSAMAEIGIESLGAGGAEEYRPEDKEPARIIHKQPYRIPGVESLEHRRAQAD